MVGVNIGTYKPTYKTNTRPTHMGDVNNTIYSPYDKPSYLKRNVFVYVIMLIIVVVITVVVYFMVFRKKINTDNKKTWPQKIKINISDVMHYFNMASETDQNLPSTRYKSLKDITYIPFVHVGLEKTSIAVYRLEWDNKEDKDESVIAIFNHSEHQPNPPKNDILFNYTDGTFKTCDNVCIGIEVDKSVESLIHIASCKDGDNTPTQDNDIKLQTTNYTLPCKEDANILPKRKIDKQVELMSDGDIQERMGMLNNNITKWNEYGYDTASYYSCRDGVYSLISCVDGYIDISDKKCKTFIDSYSKQCFTNLTSTGVNKDRYLFDNDKPWQAYTCSLDDTKFYKIFDCPETQIPYINDENNLECKYKCENGNYYKINNNSFVKCPSGELVLCKDKEIAVKSINDPHVLTCKQSKIDSETYEDKYSKYRFKQSPQNIRKKIYIGKNTTDVHYYVMCHANIIVTEDGVDMEVSLYSLCMNYNIDIDTEHDVVLDILKKYIGYVPKYIRYEDINSSTLLYKIQPCLNWTRHSGSMLLLYRHPLVLSKEEESDLVLCDNIAIEHLNMTTVYKYEKSKGEFKQLKINIEIDRIFIKYVDVDDTKRPIGQIYTIVRHFTDYNCKKITVESDIEKESPCDKNVHGILFNALDKTTTNQILCFNGRRVTKYDGIYLCGIELKTLFGVIPLPISYTSKTNTNTCESIGDYQVVDNIYSINNIQKKFSSELPFSSVNIITL